MSIKYVPQRSRSRASVVENVRAAWVRKAPSGSFDSAPQALSGETLLPQLRFLRQASELPGLFIVSDDDEYPPTVEAMEWLYDCSASAQKQFIHYIGPKAPWLWYETSDPSKVPATGSHGTDLFKRHPELPATIVDWFVNTLIRTPGHAQPMPWRQGEPSIKSTCPAGSPGSHSNSWKPGAKTPRRSYGRR